MPGVGLAFLEDSIVMAFAEKRATRPKDGSEGIILTDCAEARGTHAKHGSEAYSPTTHPPSAGLKNALAGILSRSRTRVKDVAISIPDTAVKAVVLEFDELPANRQEAGEVIKWKAAKGFSVRPEDCVVAYQTIGTAKGKKIFAAIADRKTIEGYEDAVSEAGIGVSAVGIHSLNILNLFSESTAGETEGSFFAVTAAKSFFSVMAVRDGAMDFYRCRETSEGEDYTPQIEATFASYKGKNPDADMRVAYILGGGRVGMGRGGFSGVQAKDVPVENLVTLGNGVRIDGIPLFGALSAAGAAAIR